VSERKMSNEALKIVVNDKLTDISELKVTELKQELKKRGVSTTGNKQELFEKLKIVSFFPNV
jgi:hypothetical protein